MKLPNLDLAEIPEAKVANYLLNPTHPIGGPKANFFMRFGFERENWRMLAAALLKQARENEVTERAEDSYGMRYVIDGRIIAPDGTRLNIRTAWFIDTGGTAPRFITAHPLPK